MHILLRAKAPSMADIEVRIMLMGLNKTMLTPICQAHLITPDILLDLVEYLDLTKRCDLVFWSTLVVGFFTFFRKSNLLPDSMDSFNPCKQLARGDVRFEGSITIVTITWSKTIQYRQRQVEVPLFPIPDSPLCPVSVLRAMLQMRGRPTHHLFAEKVGIPLTYSKFQKKFKSVLKQAGYDERMFSSHSMRRGGTLWAFRSGVPDTLIQVQGDWTSDAYKRYLSFLIEVRAMVNLKMRRSIQS